MNANCVVWLTSLVLVQSHSHHFEERARLAFQRYAKIQGCGACIAAGGAWCLDSSRCVPDARTMCGPQSTPKHHVGMAGRGRCPNRNDFVRQVYLHAPRRPPLQSTRSAPAAVGHKANNATGTLQCPAFCAVPSPSSRDHPGKASLQDHFETCGAVVLRNVLSQREVHKLRDAIVKSLRLDSGALDRFSAATLHKSDTRHFHKYELPGVRGSRRHELVLPCSARFVQPIRAALVAQRATLATLLRFEAPSVEFVSVMASWPGAQPQELHRDAEAGSEAALLVFIPLEDMAETGPPELCACTHRAQTEGGLATATTVPECGNVRFAAEPRKVALGSALVYDPGLVHRGTTNKAHSSGKAEPRLMLHISIAPRGSRVRARPESLLGETARNHVKRWRALSLDDTTGPNTHSSQGHSSRTMQHLVRTGCESQSPFGCSACLTTGYKTKPNFTGCAWCAESRTCVADLAGLCQHPKEHHGQAGLGGLGCPKGELRL